MAILLVLTLSNTADTCAVYQHSVGRALGTTLRLSARYVRSTEHGVIRPRPDAAAPDMYVIWHSTQHHNASIRSSRTGLMNSIQD